MRTTLTLEPDVAQKLKSAIKRNKQSLKSVVNLALRAGLEQTAPRIEAFRVEPHACGVRAGIDPDKFNQLVEEIDAEKIA